MVNIRGISSLCFGSQRGTVILSAWYGSAAWCLLMLTGGHKLWY